MRRLALLVALVAVLVAAACVGPHVTTSSSSSSSSARAELPDPDCLLARRLEEWYWLDLTDLDAHTTGNDAAFGHYARGRLQQFHAAFETAANDCPALTP